MKTGQFMKATGRTAKDPAMGDSFMLTEQHTSVNGRMTQQTEAEFLKIYKVTDTKVNGLMTLFTEQVLKHGLLMDQDLLARFSRIKKMAKEDSIGQMEAIMKEIFKMEFSMAQENTTSKINRKLTMVSL